MFEWLAAKLLSSKNLRVSVRDLYLYLTSSPEWKKDIIELKAKIKRRDRELAKKFGHAISLKMQDGFGSGDMNNFLSAFYELADNGFAHGCVTDNDSITVRAVIFGAGASAEVINNNRSKQIPDVNQLRSADPTGGTGRGLKRVFSLASQVSITHGGRGLKIVLYKHATSHHLVEEGITFINVGGFSMDVAAKIDRSLTGKSGDVVIVFGPDVHESIRYRAAAEIEKKEFVGKFAVVTDNKNQYFFPDQSTYTSKFVGCFISPEEAISALHPGPPDSTAASTPAVAAKRRRGKSPTSSRRSK
jgi:hypothetical protein